MEFNLEIMNVLMNYGALGVCLGYFIYKDNKTTKELKETVGELREVVSLIKDRILQD